MGSTERERSNLPIALLDKRMIYYLCLSLVVALGVGAFAGTEGYTESDDGDLGIASSWNEDALARMDSISAPVSSEKGSLSASECGELEFDTVVGDIEIMNYYIPEEMPLCISNETMSNWYVDLFVTGGYEPIDAEITLYQKGQRAGMVYVDWIRGEKPDCCHEWWQATFYLKQNICLDSNQYPVVDDPWSLCAPCKTIPDKEVIVDIWTKWTGCECETQHFTIKLTDTNFSYHFPNSPLQFEVE
ncbi:MAG: hypothetical protein GF309_06560 [Candidatus Lokiarchaeota archaeon]|nr:hypothetical protein [Candidatus Lokiarchaeota archaeon]